MKSHPILFKAEMVRAILEDRKSQTRRLQGLDFMNQRPLDFSFLKMEEVKGELVAAFWDAPKGGTVWVKSPKGKIGDRLWVQETFCDVPLPWVDENGWAKYIYRATDGKKPQMLKWKPSIFMPRKASRLTLELTAVRVERLNDISEADAIAEGVADTFDARIASNFVGGKPGPAQMEYWALWESINGKGSWAQNPWVWIYEFKKP